MKRLKIQQLAEFRVINDMSNIYVVKKTSFSCLYLGKFYRIPEDLKNAEILECQILDGAWLKIIID